MVERALILCKNEYLSESDFMTNNTNKADLPQAKINYNLEENELNLIRLALIEKNYNQNRTAELLGITRDSLIRRLKKFGIQLSKSGNFET